MGVSYGAGGEFKADKQWSGKMEANVAEALIGALSSAGLHGLASACICLCLICYVAWPDAVLPSNWTMADKALVMDQAWQHGGRSLNDEAALLHLNLPALARQMDAWLAE